MVEVVTLGCRINSYESEVLKEKFKNVDNLIIVNTCAVTGEARTPVPPDDSQTAQKQSRRPYCRNRLRRPDCAVQIRRHA